MPTRLLLPLVSWLALASLAGGEERRPITLEETLRVARARNRDLLATREHLVQVKADVDRAMALLLPTVSAQGKYTLNNKEVTLSLEPGPLSALAAKTQQDTLTDLYTQTGKLPGQAVQQDTAALLSFCRDHPEDSAECSTSPIVIQKQNQLDFIASAQVPIVVPYAWYQLRGAKQAYAAQARSAEATEAQLLEQVAVSFYAAAGNDELVNAQQHAVEVAQKTLETSKARLEAGVVNRVDVARAEQALIKSQQDLREAQNAAERAYRALRTLAQLDGDFRVVPPEAPPSVEAPVPSLVGEALRLRPELLAYDAQIAAADSNVTANKLRWAPTLTAFGLLRAFNAAGFAGDHYAWGVGLQLDWLLYDAGLRQAGERQFASAAREAALRRGQLRDQISDEVENDRAQVELKRQAVETAGSEVALGRETLELLRTQNLAGTATQLDLLTAQSALVAAEVGMARARFDLGLADLQLKRATGVFP